MEASDQQARCILFYKRWQYITPGQITLAGDQRLALAEGSAGSVRCENQDPEDTS
jgi:hypothetical protein